MHTCLFNFEDDLVDLLLEHQYAKNPARHLYQACWFLSLASLGDQCLFLTYPNSLNAGDLC